MHTVAAATAASPTEGRSDSPLLNFSSFLFLANYSSMRPVKHFLCVCIVKKLL